MGVSGWGEVLGVLRFIFLLYLGDAGVLVIGVVEGVVGRISFCSFVGFFD